MNKKCNNGNVGINPFGNIVPIAIKELFKLMMYGKIMSLKKRKSLRVLFIYYIYKKKIIIIIIRAKMVN